MILGGAALLAAPGARADVALFEVGHASFEAKCALCHAVEAGAGNGVGPNLHAVLGRAIGRANGFAYSQALASAPGTWDAAALASFLQEPKKFFPGTVMPFAGLKAERERKAVVCYLSGEPEGSLCR